MAKCSQITGVFHEIRGHQDTPEKALVSLYYDLYNNQINARALIGQSAVGYCTGKPTEKLRVF